MRDGSVRWAEAKLRAAPGDPTLRLSADGQGPMLGASQIRWDRRKRLRQPLGRELASQARSTRIEIPDPGRLGKLPPAVYGATRSGSDTQRGGSLRSCGGTRPAPLLHRAQAHIRNRLNARAYENRGSRSMLSGCLASRHQRPFEETTASAAGGARLLDVCQERPRRALTFDLRRRQLLRPCVGQG
jgi:hypothetical protein